MYLNYPVVKYVQVLSLPTKLLKCTGCYSSIQTQNSMKHHGWNIHTTLLQYSSRLVKVRQRYLSFLWKGQCYCVISHLLMRTMVALCRMYSSNLKGKWHLFQKEMHYLANILLFGRTDWIYMWILGIYVCAILISFDWGTT